MNNDQKRFFLAVVLSGVILIGWQFLFAPKMAPIPGNESGTVAVNSSASNSGNVTSGNTAAVSSTGNTSGTSAGNHALNGNMPTGNVVPLEVIKGNSSYILSSNLGIYDIKNEKDKYPFLSTLGLTETSSNPSSKTINVNQMPPVSLQVLIDDKYVPVNLETLPSSVRSSPSTNTNSINEIATYSRFEGSNNEYGVKLVAFVQDDGRMKYQLTSNQARRFRFVIESRKGQMEGRTPREFLLLTKDVERFEVGKDKKGEGQIKWFGVDFNFHLFAITFDDVKSATYAASPTGVLTVDTNGPLSDLSGTLVYVKKNYDELTSLGDNLKLSVDFGFFGILAVPILRGLQFFYKFIPNYGISIIFLTILLRIVTFPLQHKSYKSMKKMQDLRPQMDKIKEKFKDDPQRMQKETMELFKRAGANPFGGCIPLLIQLPIFIAFYKVLYSAVELIDAPFFGWVRDLSAKDPYYILPLLMTITMFIQQKMTPTTGMDPAQQKIMMFMPIIFGFIMKDLPSGLALYIFVSTLIGILQQMIIYKQKLVIYPSKKA